MQSRSSLKLVTSGQKLSHRVKSKENLLNTLEVTFFKVIINSLAPNVCHKLDQNVFSMISKSSMKRDHFGSKLGHSD